MIVHLNRLDRVHPELVRVVLEVGATEDLVVIQGARTVAEEEMAIAMGTSTLMDPTHSKHVIIPGIRDEADAVDLARYPLNWMDTAGFQSLAMRMKDRADYLGVRIVWGGDWVSLKDLDHFERAA